MRALGPDTRLKTQSVFQGGNKSEHFLWLTLPQEPFPELHVPPSFHLTNVGHWNHSPHLMEEETEAHRGQGFGLA